MRKYPPLCTNVGLMLVPMLAIQIWSFCATVGGGASRSLILACGWSESTLRGRCERVSAALPLKRRRAAGGQGPRRSRRQLLAGGTGALAAVLAAEALARPAPAAAADGDPVLLGHDGNTETRMTIITNSTAGADVLLCVASGAGFAVRGASDTGAGVLGVSNTSGIGVGGFRRPGKR